MHVREVRRLRADQNGLTLIELVISITLLSISLSAIMVVFSDSVANSATPMAREQSVFIARSYMEEIIFQPYIDPTGISTDCASTNRTDYNDLDDYGCINDTNGAIGQDGIAITGLEAYNVVVTITPITDLLVANINAKQIDVNVTRDGVDSINTTLTTYRTEY